MICVLTFSPCLPTRSHPFKIDALWEVTFLLHNKGGGGIKKDKMLTETFLQPLRRWENAAAPQFALLFLSFSPHLTCTNLLTTPPPHHHHARPRPSSVIPAAALHHMSTQTCSPPPLSSVCLLSGGCCSANTRHPVANRGPYF